MKKKSLIICICFVLIILLFVVILIKRINGTSNSDALMKTEENYFVESQNFDEGVVVYDKDGNVRGIAYSEYDLKMFEDDPDFYVTLEAPVLYRDLDLELELSE